MQTAQPRRQKAAQPGEMVRPTDPKWSGGDPQFQIHSMANNGLWDSEEGHLDNPWFDPTMINT